MKKNKHFSLFSFVLFIAFLFASVSLQGQDTVKVMHYNLLFYGNCQGVTSTQKDGWLETISSHYQPDILTVNEMSDRIAFANRIKSRALTYGPMEYTEFTNTTNSDIINMLFYNTEKFGYLGIEKIGTSLRDINVYTLYHKNAIQGSDTTFLYCIVAHLKASSDAASENQRAVAAQQIIDWISSQPSPDNNYMLLGDLNIYGANEAAWQTLVRNTNTTKLYDPAGLTNGWNASSIKYMTQSTRCTSVGDCGVPGCLDDRFDFILPTNAIMTGAEGVAYVTDSYAAYGNDGNTPFNGAIGDNCSGNTSVPGSVCNALINMSDHFPVVLELAFLNASSNEELEDKLPALTLHVAQENEAEVKIRANGLQAGSLYYLQILDLQGRQIAQRQKIAAGDKEDWGFNLSNIPMGMYVLKLADGSGARTFQKWMKY